MKKKFVEVACPVCGNKTKFDLSKVPTGVKFDYQCEKCGTLHMIQL